ncbi:MAG: translocation/assembly module TamB domain-containing protein [Synechococcus sp.]
MWRVAIPLALVGAGGWFALDRLAGAWVSQMRPEVERQVSQQLGHPTRIGAYRGLRFWGIALGPITVAPGPSDASTASVRSAGVVFDPVASLLRWKPVAVVRLQGLRLNLRRNAQGTYWVPGVSGGAEDPPLPSVDLSVRLSDPAHVRIEPVDLQLQVSGEATFHLDQARGDAAVRVMFPEQGRLALRMTGGWRQPQLDVQARVERLQLQALQGFLPASSPFSLDGQLAGDLRLGWQAGQAQCSGGLSFVNVSLQADGERGALRSPRLQVSCQGDRLQIPRSTWSYGAYRATLGGDVALNRTVDLSVNLQEPGQDRELRAALTGPWRQPRLAIDGRWRVPDGVPLAAPIQFRAQLTGDWRHQRPVRAQLDHLALKAPGLVLTAKGGIYPALNINTEQFELAGSAWSGLPVIPDLLGQRAPVRGSVQLRGATQSPEISLALSQQVNPVLQAWSLQADWTAAEGIARLQHLRSAELQAHAALPLRWTGGSAQVGDLNAAVQLRAFPLDRLGALGSTPLGGLLSASGGLTGPLGGLRPTFGLQVEAPRVGPLRLAETWSGRFDGRAGGGGQVQMTATSGARVGAVAASLGPNWLPTDVTLQRQHGELTLVGSPQSYRWRAQRLPLDGVELALPPKGRFEGLYGHLTGEGTLGLKPMEMAGAITLEQPGLLGLQLRQARLEGAYRDHRYQLTGELLPPRSGQVLVTASGRLGAGLEADLDAQGLSARWFTDGLRKLSDLNRDQRDPHGHAADLGTLLVDTFGGSINGQLKALRQLKTDWAAKEQRGSARSPFHPDDLRGQMDAVIKLRGPSLADLNLALQARGHLWIEGEDVDHALQIQPFVATLRGPVHGGVGEFSLQHLPFTLLALVVPVPPALVGAVGLSGQYRLGESHGPELTMELVLENASIGSHRLRLNKGQITLTGKTLLLDLALKDEAASESVVLTGQVPLEASGALDLRLLAQGDGLRFLTGFTDDRVAWTGGDVRLRLILTGTRQAPQANGFLVVDQGGFALEQQQISEVNASVVFDFNRLDVQSLQARVGTRGRLQGKGGLGLFRSTRETEPLTLALTQSRLSLPVADVAVTADLTVQGALVRPRLGGKVEISNGTIRPAPVVFARRDSTASDPKASGSPKPVAMTTLLEEQWDFEQPLVLLGPEVEADTSRSLKAAIPQLPALRFDNLRVRFGPKLAVTVAPVAAFTTQGLLTLNGALDPSLQLQGVVQMLTGRISFFTTTFQLDPRVANVAVFTPSMGLVPYVDVAMVSRVSDSVRDGGGNSAVSGDVFQSNGTGSLGAAGQLRLVKVMVDATGPADRLADNLVLRSVPPMPRGQLLGLIGGNSLAGVSQSGGGAALAAVLGQSLLTPVIGTLSDAFSQRLQFALYPTYVSPQIQDEQERVSGQVPPQFALVTELGLDLNERFNFSVLVAPNRNDIAPQGTLSYQINNNLGLSGSVDNQGTWQTQVQVFFRF